MATVEVRLPALLQPMAGGTPLVVVEAATMTETLTGLIDAHPALAVHLFDETGRFRRHVLCFHNDTRWQGEPDTPVSPGDRITVLQAVSGG